MPKGQPCLYCYIGNLAPETAELERLEFAPPADPGPVQTFEPNGPERGFATMCANCGQTFGKHIAQDHSGNSSVCPVHETGDGRG